MRTSRALFPVVVVLAVLLAACAGLGVPTPTSRAGDAPAAGSPEGTPAPDESRPSDDGPPVDVGDGNFRLLISDQRNVIGDFAHLFVEIDRVGLRSEEDGGWLELDVPEDVGTVDLVGLTGEAAAQLIQAHVPPGLYTRVFIHIDGVEGELKSGESTPVRLPSSKLQIREPFEVSETAVTSFVFDLTVIAAGNERSGIKYLLQPVVGESGASKRFREVRPERPGKGTLSISLEGRPEPGARLTVGVADAGGAPVEGAHVTVQFEIDAGQADADGVLRFTAPPGTKAVKVRGELEDRDLEGELRASFADDGTVETDTDDEGLVLRMKGDFSRGRQSAVVVTDAEGRPVDVVIQLRFEVDAGDTDGLGQVTFFVPEHTADLKIEARKGDERGRLKVDLDRGEPDGGRGDRDGGQRGQRDDGQRGDRLVFKVAIEGEPVAGTRLMVTVSGPAGRPVEGADILVNGERAGATDGDGRLAVAVPKGAETLAIEARSRSGRGELKIDLRSGALSDQRTVIEARPMLHMTFEGEPTPGARVAVVITGPNRRPAAEARVSINGRSVRPDRNGRVTFTVPDDARVIEIEAAQGRAAGKLRIEVRRPGASGREVGDVSGTTGAGPEPKELHLKLDGELVPGSKLTVFVFDENAHPVAGAAVIVNDDGVGVTNDDGAVAFVAPERASVLEIAARLGDAKGGLRVELHAPEDALEPEPGDALEHEPEDALGDEPEDALEHEPEDALGGEPEDALEHEPEDALGDEPEDALEHEPVRLVLAIEGERVVGGELTLVVTDADGNPIAGAEVHVNDELAGMTDADGRLTFKAPEGADEVKIVVEVAEAREALRVELQAPEPSTDADSLA